MPFSKDDLMEYHGEIFDSGMVYTGLEPLLVAIFRGTLSQYDGCKPSLEEVNEKNRQGKTLLHLAVRMGIIDSVERLLQWGADLSVLDGIGATALDVAEVFQDVSDRGEERKGIRKLLHLVSKRESVLRGVEKGKEVASGGDSDRVGLEVVEGLSQEVKHQREVLSMLKEELVQHVTRSLKKDVVTEMQVIQTALMSRDELLEKLEASITSLVERSHSSWGKIDERLGVVLGDRTQTYQAKILAIITCNEAAIRLDCIEELMKRTEVWPKKTVENVKLVKNLYESVYERNPVVCFLPRFWQSGAEFHVVIDCNSSNIGNIRKKVVDHTGSACDGKHMVAFADLEGRVVYSGTKGDRTAESIVSRLVMCLAQMANLLAFENEGRPYRAGSGSEEQATQYKEALKDLEKKWESDCYEFDSSVNPWIKSSSPLQREVYSISVVPGMIAYYGLRDGHLRASRKMRSLTRFYEDWVVPELERLLGESTSTAINRKIGFSQLFIAFLNQLTFQVANVLTFLLAISVCCGGETIED